MLTFSAKFKSGAGFTIIELLVVSTIIAILTATFFVNYRNQSDQFAVQRAAHKLAQDIRKANGMAMAAEKCCGGIIPPNYGIWLKASTTAYVLYADIDPDGPGGPEEPDQFYKPSKDEIIGSAIELERGVTIVDVSPPTKQVSINFTPPSPTVTIMRNPGEDETQAVIVLGIGSYTKSVIVNAAGLIEIQ